MVLVDAALSSAHSGTKREASEPIIAAPELLTTRCARDKCGSVLSQLGLLIRLIAVIYVPLAAPRPSRRIKPTLRLASR